MYPQTILAADVGGTHTRFAVVTVSDTSPWKLSHRLDVAGQFPDFPSVLRAYFDRCGLDGIPRGAVIAAAGPVASGKVALTNRSLRISESELLQFGFERARLINDFAALAFAADVLGSEDLRTIGPSVDAMAGAPISVLGAGTGFGVSYLVRASGRAIAVATEGGHITFAATDEHQLAVLATLKQWYGHVSVERILCGNGLEALHRLLANFAKREFSPTSAAAISSGALSGDAACCESLSLFCSIYGAVAGDMALAHGARGARGMARLMMLGSRVFADRSAAGAALARKLLQQNLHPPLLVLGLARGGVPVACEVARRLHAPLDVLVVRKVGMPGEPEVAIGAVASGNITVRDPEIAARADGFERMFERLAQEQRHELERRERLYREGLPPLDLHGRTVIIVDDGLATGSTMLAAIRAARQGGAATIVAASPVASAEATRLVGAEADRVIVLEVPQALFAIGSWYEDFEQLEDSAVCKLLERSRKSQNHGGSGRRSAI